MAMVEGYDVEVIQEISSDLYCVICLKLMRNPVQFKCGHGMCYVCFKSLLHRSSQRSSTQCPQCREVVKESNIVSNVMLHRLILSLTVRCMNHERGCKWTGELDRFECHFDQCTKTPENPSSNKKSKKKKAKKELTHDQHPRDQSLQNELLLQITEQLSKLNDRLHSVTMDGSGGGVAITKTKTDEQDTWFTHFFVKSVTASGKTKFLALFLFTISLLSGMHLLGNPLWGSTSPWKGESPEAINLQKGFHQIQMELTKINSLIYAQQNNFFQLHLGSKELQTELESQKTMFLKLLGLYMRNTLHDVHFKKTGMLDHVTELFTNEMLKVRELEQKLIHQFGKIKHHSEMQMRLMEKQPLDKWFFKRSNTEELVLNLLKMLDGSNKDLSLTVQLANTTSRGRISSAFQEARRKVKNLQEKITDFKDFTYIDVKQHLVKEFKKSDAVIADKLNETSEQSLLTVLSEELEGMYNNMSRLSNQTLQEYQRQASYQYQFNAVIKSLENVDTKNGHFIWRINSTILPSLPDGHGYYSRPFTAVASRTLLEPSKFAKLWLLRASTTGEGDGTWKVTYEQEANTPVNINIAILNQLNEAFLPCKETYREPNDPKKVIVDFSIPQKLADLVSNGFIEDDQIFIRCTVVPK